MFGYHRAKRQRKKLKKEVEAFNKQKQQMEAQKPPPPPVPVEVTKPKTEHEEKRDFVTERARESAEDRAKAREEGRKYAEEVFRRPIEGLSDAERKAMQLEAHQQIKRSHQSANRRLLGEQSRHGIIGRGGVGYAQQRDLQKLADEAHGAALRDREKLDRDLKLRNRVGMVTLEQGEAAQNQIDRQLAIDELEMNNEKKRQKRYEDQINRLFSRI
jgi:hypothetical protein